MAQTKVSFDFRDNPEIVRLLRLLAAEQGTSQKSIVVRALEAYFATQVDHAFLRAAADRVFTEWDNQEDAVYDSL